jgi:hypothetical protein
MFSITVNGLTSQLEPIGTEQLVHRRYFSDELAGYLEEINGNVIFGGDAYHELRRFSVATLCRLMPVTITDECGLNLKANIFLNDCEWDLSKCQVSCQLVDAGFLSLVENNMAIRAYVNVPRSKNDVDITTRTNVTTDLKIWNTSYTTVGTNRKGITIWAAFDFIIAFMTDGALGFVSDYFSSGEDAAIYSYLTTAVTLRDETVDSYPYLSFQDLYVDLNKMCNLAFDIEYVGGSPRMRIEPKSYFRTQANSFTFQNAAYVSQMADRSKFYSKVKFGSAEQVEIGAVQSTIYPVAPFLNQKNEEYHLGGQCNTQAILDLQQRELTTDTNAIFDCFPVSLGGQATEDYDAAILLLQFDSNKDVLWEDPITGLANIVVLLNIGWVQKAIAARWFGFIPNSIFLFLGLAQDDSLAYSTSQQVISPAATEPIEFANDTTFPAYDPNNNITQGTFGGFPATFYTAPAAGVYTVDLRIIYSSNTFDALTIVIQRRDSGSVLQETATYTALTPNILTLSYEFICDVGDTLMVFAQLLDGTIFAGSTFGVRSLYGQIISGGEWAEFRIEDTDIMLTRFNYTLPYAEWRTVLQGFNKLSTVTYSGGGSQKGYLKDVSRNLQTGVTDVTLMGKLNN